MMGETLATPNSATTQTPISGKTRVMDLACAVAFALLATQSVALLTSAIVFSHPLSHSASDLAGIFFLVFAFLYRGSLTTWWLVLAPLSLLLLFAPVARWESTEIFEYGNLLRSALGPSLCFLAGAGFVLAKNARTGAFAATVELRELGSRHHFVTNDLKSLENDMKDVLQTLTDVSPSRLAPFEFKVDQSRFSPAVEPSEAMAQADLLRVLNSEIDRVRAASHRGLRVTLTAATDTAFPLAVRAEAQTLEKVVRHLLGQAIAAIGPAGSGVIRVAMRAGLRSISISFEDNGRGLNEDMILRLEAKGLVSKDAPMGLAEIRRLVQASGWRMEMQARLGVGARVTIELSRVDALAYGARVSNRTSPMAAAADAVI